MRLRIILKTDWAILNALLINKKIIIKARQALSRRGIKTRRAFVITIFALKRRSAKIKTHVTIFVAFFIN